MSVFYEELKKDVHRQYIHLQRKHIGALYGYGSWGNLSSILSESRNRGRLLNNYRNYFVSSLSKDAKEMFRDLTNMEKDKVIKNANVAMQEVLEQKLSADLFKQLYEIKQNMVSATSIANKLKNNTNALLECDNLLVPISQAIKMIETADGGDAILADLLTKNLKSGQKMRALNMGIKIEKAVDTFLNSNNYKGLTGAKLQAMDESVRALNNLAQNLKTRQKKGAKSNEYLGKDSWTTIFSNLFSLSFVESLGAVALEHAFAASSGAVVDMVGGKSSKGTKITYREEGAIRKNQIVTNKTDLKGKHLSFNFLENTILGEKSNFEIDLGISMKFYDSIGFDKLSSKGLTGTFSSGSGGSLGAALVDVYGFNPKKLYLAKNILAHDANTEKSLESGLKTIQNALLTKEILRLFATMGNKKDFSHFILVNGKFISTWDLLNYTLDNFVGSSASQGAFKEGQGVALTIKGRKSIYEANSRQGGKKADLEEAKRRSQLVNDAIDRATIEARIHINNLARAIKK